MQTITIYFFLPDPQKLEKEVADESISTARAKIGGPQMNGARSKPHYSGNSSDPRGKADNNQHTYKFCM
jgi:hypothetical protein